MTKAKLLYGLCTLILVGAAFAAGHAVGAKAKTATYLPAGELKWNPLDPANPNGPKIAALWGDPMKGAYGGLLKLPAGFTSPAHTHSGDYQAVEIQGTSSHWTDTETQAAAKPLPPGSYWSMPGKVSHVSSCAAGADCIVFITQKGKFDFKMTPPPKGAAPVEPPKPATPPVMAPKKTP